MDTRSGVEDTRLKAKAENTKKFGAKANAKDSPSEDRHFRGQEQECSRPRIRGQAFSKKKDFKNFFLAISKRKKQKTYSQIFRKVCGVFLHNFKNEQISTIVGTAANDHHTIWGSSDINLRKEDPLGDCVCADLNFCNAGNKPTFRIKTR